MKRSKNKWHFIFSVSHDFRRVEIGWRLFQFGILKPKFNWPEGTELRRPYYKGFFIRFYLWWPFERY